MVRGFVIVLMALDHVRDYVSNVHQGLLDPAGTTIGIYVTRWITHLCAPTFIFLTGISAYLVSKRSTLPELRRYLLARGLWIIFLEMTLVLFAWTFEFNYAHGLFLQVMWAIGGSMIALAAVVHLSSLSVCAIGFAMIALHNTLDGIAPDAFGAWATLWNLLHVHGDVWFGRTSYPLIPWIGVMMLGYGLGRLYDASGQVRRQAFTRFGVTALIAFVLLRWLNVYGDPHPWRMEDSIVKTAMSFFDVEKYPPSLLYLLCFLGIALLLLAVCETRRERLNRLSVLQLFGRVPLFFYVIHLYVVHLVAGLIALSLGWHTAVLTSNFRTLPPDWGLSLPWVYLVWLCVLGMMYPLCRWFANVKRTRTDWWLSYL